MPGGRKWSGTRHHSCAPLAAALDDTRSSVDDYRSSTPSQNVIADWSDCDLHHAEPEHATVPFTLILLPFDLFSLEPQFDANHGPCLFLSAIAVASWSILSIRLALPSGVL